MKNIRAAVAVLGYLTIVSLAGYNLRNQLFGSSTPSASANSTMAAPAQTAPESTPAPGAQSNVKAQPDTSSQPSPQAGTSAKATASSPSTPPSTPTEKIKETHSPQPSFPVAGNGAVDVGERLPDFLLVGLNGNSLNEGALRGHKTLFIIVSASCPHCQKDLKLLHVIENDYPSIEPVFAAVNQRDEAMNLASITGEGDHIYTGARDLATSLGVTGVPFILLIDEKGVIRAIHKGEMDEPTFRDLLGKFSHGQPVAQLPVNTFFGE